MQGIKRKSDGDSVIYFNKDYYTEVYQCSHMGWDRCFTGKVLLCKHEHLSSSLHYLPLLKS